MPDIVLDYAVTAPTLRRFHASRAFFRGIRGPFGSGKTTACLMELAMRAAGQRPGPDGVRRSRWALVRNTAPELLSTTIKSFQQWFPPETGKWSYDSPITFTMRRGDVHAEFCFLALDLADDVRKLLSLELTGAYINEAREVLKEIVDGITGRVGRWPPRRDGGCTWSGIVADTNSPDLTHWWAILAERDTSTEFGRQMIESTDAAEAQLRAEGVLAPDQRLYEWFAQPSGRSPEAENLENLEPGYYTRLAAGKQLEWQKIYIDAEYGFQADGRAVFPQYRDSVHLAEAPMEPARGVPLLIGADWGLTPAAVIGQRLADGQWLLVDELVTTDCGIVRFAELLATYVAQQYPNFDCEGFGDPAGNQRAQTDERTVFDIMKSHTPWRWRPAPSNDVQMRLEVVRNALSRLIDGKSGLIVSPRCAMLRRALAGGYRYKQVRLGLGVNYSETPDKNEFSHCFVDGTLVATPTGERAIESLRVGDVVSTPYGPRSINAAMSRVADGLLDLSFSNGRSVRCTKDHPFLVNGEARRADALQIGDVLHGIGGESWADRQSTPSKCSTTFGITGSRGGTSRKAARRSTCIAWCGPFTMARSLLGITFTTGTGIAATMTLPTLSACLGVSMSRTTGAKGCRAGPSERNNIWTGFALLLRRGMDRPRVARGIAPTLRRDGLAAKASTAFASIAARLMRLCAARSSAATAACAAKEWRARSGALMTNAVSVSSAALASLPIGMCASKHAVSLVAKQSCGDARARVYDLTVDGAHCFYAAGVLVSNCADALQYLLSGGGEASVVLGKQRRGPRAALAVTDYSTFG